MRKWALFFCSTLLSAVAIADDSIDKLLNEADQALGNPTKTEGKKSGVESDTSGNARMPQRKTLRAKSAPVEVLIPPSRAENAPVKQDAVPLTPIDPARVSEILALDLQTQERDRLARGRGVSARIGFIYDHIPGAYQVEKDDDTFTMATPAALKGVGIEAAAGSMIGQPRGKGFFRGASFWGLNGGAGVLQGDVEIQRRGIEDEDTTYQYQLIPLDGGISFGWANENAFSFWVSLGYAADVVRQVGRGQTDSFTAVFSGETAAIGTSWRSALGYEVFGQYRQRGVLGQSKEPTRSRVAGRMITVGIGVPIAG